LCVSNVSQPDVHTPNRLSDRIWSRGIRRREFRRFGSPSVACCRRVVLKYNAGSTGTESLANRVGGKPYSDRPSSMPAETNNRNGRTRFHCDPPVVVRTDRNSNRYECPHFERHRARARASDKLLTIHTRYRHAYRVACLTRANRVRPNVSRRVDNSVTEKVKHDNGSASTEGATYGPCGRLVVGG